MLAICIVLTPSLEASKRVRLPTAQDLATVWVGGDPGGTEYLRLELSEDGTGLLAIQYLPDRPADAYRVLHTTQSKYRVWFTVEPVDEAEPIYMSGTAIPGRLDLSFGSSNPEWQRNVVLERETDLLARLDAVRKRAEELKGVLAK